MVSEERRKEIEEQHRIYDEHLENVVDKLEKAEDAIGEMIEFCSYGEPELFGSKAMKSFFWNLGCLCHNGMSFIWNEQKEIKYSKVEKD